MLTFRKQALEIIRGQAKVLLLGSMVFGIVNGGIAAISFLLGGLITISANGLFAFYLFAQRGAQASKAIWRGCCRGEILKWLYTSLLCYLAFKFVSVNPLLFLLGFGLPHLLLIGAWRLLPNNEGDLRYE